jgi:hypothetical protein
MSGLRRHGRHSGHSTCAAGPQNLSAAVRGMRWQGNQSGLTLPRAAKPEASATARHTGRYTPLWSLRLLRFYPVKPGN